MTKQQDAPVDRLFYEADEGGYDVTVVWPNGTRTRFLGAQVTAEQICEALTELIAEIRQSGAEDVQASA
jgi:hypothetical protein